MMIMTAMKTRMRGVSLIELMISLVIGSILLIGTVSVYMNSRNTYRVNETMARIQENARFALDIMEPDLRLASFWGRTSSPAFLQDSATAVDPIPAGLAVAGDCRVNWAIDLNQIVEGFNNNYPYGAGCAAFGAGVQAGTDVLVIRHVAGNPIAAAIPGTVQLMSSRMNGQLFADGVQPLGFPATATMHNLVAHGYYVAQDSGPGPLPTQTGLGIPSLRRKSLQPGPVIVDQDIISGVQDFQIQLGVDTDIVGTPTRGMIDRWVDPGNPILIPGNAAFIPAAQVVAVRIWLLVRAERPEIGFVNNTNYIYGDQNVVFNDNFRRLLVSKTVRLRNTYMN